MSFVISLKIIHLKLYFSFLLKLQYILHQKVFFKFFFAITTIILQLQYHHYVQLKTISTYSKVPRTDPCHKSKSNLYIYAIYFLSFLLNFLLAINKSTPKKALKSMVKILRKYAHPENFLWKKK